MAAGTHELRIVLVGKTGTGKSAVGNTILGRREFDSKASSNSVTLQCNRSSCVKNSQTISVIDTPGLFDTKYKNDDILEEIARCVVMSAPGPHAFILVIHAGRFTEEEESAVRDIQTLFGTEASRYMMVLFTRKDDLKVNGTTLEKFMKDSDSKLRGVVESCGNRYLAFNNRAGLWKRKKQVRELLSMIRKMVDDNGGSYYTTEMFQKVAKEIGRCEEESRKERERSEINCKLSQDTRNVGTERVMSRVMNSVKNRRQHVLASLGDVAQALKDIFI